MANFILDSGITDKIMHPEKMRSYFLEGLKDVGGLKGKTGNGILDRRKGINRAGMQKL